MNSELHCSPSLRDIEDRRSTLTESMSIGESRPLLPLPKCSQEPARQPDGSQKMEGQELCGWQQRQDLSSFFNRDQSYTHTHTHASFPLWVSPIARLP